MKVYKVQRPNCGPSGHLKNIGATGEIEFACRQQEAAAPEGTQREQFVRLSWIRNTMLDSRGNFADADTHRNWLTWQEAYSLGQTFCTAHTQVYKRVQVLEERIVELEAKLPDSL